MTFNNTNNILTLNESCQNLQFFHQKIMNEFNKDVSSIDKWNKIAAQMHDDNLMIFKIFNVLLQQNNRDKINLDYQIPLQQLQQQISKESDLLVKSSLIILSFTPCCLYFIIIRGQLFVVFKWY